MLPCISCISSLGLTVFALAVNEPTDESIPTQINPETTFFIFFKANASYIISLTNGIFLRSHITANETTNTIIDVIKSTGIPPN